MEKNSISMCLLEIRHKAMQATASVFANELH